jgi:hypothetical protein
MAKYSKAYQRIFYDVAKYSTTSLNNIHVEIYILRIFHDVAWNML